MTEDNTSDRKDELIAEGAKLGLKLDKRYSESRMEQKIAEAKAAADQPADEPAPATAEAEERAETPAPPVDEVAALKRKLAEQQAELDQISAEKFARAPIEEVAPAATAPDPGYTGVPGMTTSMDMTQPGDLQREEDERKLLMEQAARLGITNVIPPRANNESIREKINSHLEAKKQMQAVIDEQDRRRAKEPPKSYVSLRVLKLGDGKISKGVHVPGIGDIFYDRNDVIPNVELSIAQGLEERGYGEIVGG